jgi:hypothetical protein
MFERAHKAQELSNAIKAQVAAGDTLRPGEIVKSLTRDIRNIEACFLRELRALRRAHGISARESREFERALNAQILPTGDAFLRVQVEETPSTCDLDSLAASGFERLVRLYDPNWLRAEAEKEYRLGDSFFNNPLHLINGTRVVAQETGGPQHFARMLLVCQDHLKKRADLDFFSAATFVPEVAILGNSLKEIAMLGPEAERKLAGLPALSGEKVSSTVYELLVGAACVRRGLDLTMVPEDRVRKVPDFKVDGIGPIAGAIECKRRLGLTAYEIDEAARIDELYSVIRIRLYERRIHGMLEVAFTVPVYSVAIEEFVDFVLQTITPDQELEPTPTAWGSLGFRRLPFYNTIKPTRLYSPDFLSQVFRWNTLQDEWDGLICEVESPWRIIVKEFRKPLCLKWRSESEEALTKKARGITSLWADAMKQIPDGDLGFLYIAYPEGSRPSIADARTSQIRQAVAEGWHRWSVRVPAMIINRLYARPIGPGYPDLIESSIPAASQGHESWLSKLPWQVFTSQ